MARRRRPRTLFRPAALRAVVIVLVGLALLSGLPGEPAVGPGPVAAAAATATPSPVGGDLRSSGEGAGAAGNPGFALLAAFGVLGAGVLIAGATTLYVRFTRDAPR